MKRTSKGFTLVELMIVVVIIGILAAIAIPKFTSMVGKAKTTEAVQVLNQIIKGEEMYFYQQGAYIGFAWGDNCTEISFQQPGGRFTYRSTTADSLAGAMENGVSNDVNGDADGDDGLTLSIARVQGVISGSSGDDLSW